MPAATPDVVQEISPKLPPGVTLREWRPADLPRGVEFQNRYVRPAQRQTPEAVSTVQIENRLATTSI